MTGIFIILLVLVLALSYVIMDMSKKISYQYRYAVSFKKSFKKLQLPLIRFKVEGEYKTFLLDSGSQGNLLDKKFVDSLPKNLTDNIKDSDVAFIGVEGNNTTDNKTLKLKLSHGSKKFPETEFTVLDLRPTFKILEKKIQEPIAGLLGAPFFEKYRWQLDFEELVVWIKK